MTKLKAVLTRRWPLLLITLLLGSIAGWISSAVLPNRVVSSYEAQQVVLVDGAAVPATTGIATVISQAALRITRGSVAERAAATLGEPTQAQELASNITAKPDLDNLSIAISSTDSDQTTARKRVSAFVAAFLDIANKEFVAAQEATLAKVQGQADAAQKTLAAFDLAHPEIVNATVGPQIDGPTELLSEQRQRLAQNVDDAQNNLSQAQRSISTAKPYSSPDVSPTISQANDQLIPIPNSLPIRIALLGVFGVLMGVVLVLIVERVNPRLDTRDEVVDAIDRPILSEVYEVSRKNRGTIAAGHLTLESPVGESYRRVRSAIHFLQHHTPQDGAAGAPHARTGTTPLSGVGMNGSSPNGAAPLNGSSNGSGLNGAAIIGAAVNGSSSSGHNGSSRSAPAPQARPPRVFMVTSAAPSEGKSTSTVLIGMALAEIGAPTLLVGADYRRPNLERLLEAPRTPSLADRAALSMERPELNDIVHFVNDNLWIAPSGPPTIETTRLIEVTRELTEAAREQDVTVLLDTSPIEATNDAIDLLPVVDDVIIVVRSGHTTRRSLMRTVDQLLQHDARIMGCVLVGVPRERASNYYNSNYYDASETPQPTKASPSALDVPHVHETV